MKSEIKPLPFFYQLFGDDIATVRLALAEPLKEDLKSDDYWREKSKWIVEPADKTDKILFSWVRVESNSGKVSDIEDEFV